MSYSISAEERQKIIDITKLAAANWSQMKKHGEFTAISPTVKDSGSVAGSVAFSDTGNIGKAEESKSGLLPELAEERKIAALGDIKRLTIREEIKDGLNRFISRRNSQIKSAKQRIKNES